MTRQNLSLAIIAMVNDQPAIKTTATAASTNESTSPSGSLPKSFLTTINNGYEACPRPTVENEDGNMSEQSIPQTYGPRYNWTESQKSLALESFFFPYVICQIPGARLAERIGPYWVLMFATTGSSVMSLLSPLAAPMPYMFALVRILMGISQATLYPALYVLYMKWLPPSDRSRQLPLLGVGAYLGSIIASSSTGWFTASKSFGWEYAFYMPGSVCLIWSILWLFLGSSEPKHHRFISYEEVDYIESHIEAKRSDLDPSRSISWPKVLRSQHVWILVVATVTSGWSFCIVLLLLPTYLNNILHVPPVENGMINSVIYALYCICSPIVGIVSTRMIETRPFGITRLSIRKLFESVALVGQVISFIAIPMLECEKTAITLVIFMTIICFSFHNGGEVQLATEISVEFAGTIYAIGNSLGSTTGFLVPRVKTWIVTDSYDRWQWSLYFYFTSAISAIGGILFVLFARNDLQDYSKDVSQSQFDIYRSESIIRQRDVNTDFEPQEQEQIFSKQKRKSSSINRQSIDNP